MKFNEFKYERPDFDRIEKNFDLLLSNFEKASSLQEQNDIIDEITNIRNNIYTMGTLVSIRHSIDTRDKFYAVEQNFMDENMPRYENMTTKFYKKLLHSHYKDGLKSEWGEQLFNLARLQIEAFDEKIMDEIVTENKLSTKYEALVASAKIDYDGKVLNLSQLRPYMESRDRETRKSSYLAYTDFFKTNEAEIDKIYDDLVAVRDKMARKLGYENYVNLGYKRLGRSDYNPQMVAKFREQVKDEIVPFVSELRERQRKRLGLDILYYYDETIEYNSGNAYPKGGPDWIVEKGKIMYAELSKETKEFFDFMVEKDLLDLLSKAGKRSGGFCTVIPDYKAPFIFSNFNGTSGDIDVLTHEAGHAFQTYMSMGYKLPEYKLPTLEACEIHSMSMEFLTWPWMEGFFKEDVDKYKFSHLVSGLSFIPYGVAIDEFQHLIYQNPEATPTDRKNMWRDLERKYLPFKDYTGNDFLERGGYWMRQAHVFSNPFYYIDYTLAQVCAFQFWHKSRTDRETAWNDYLALCKKGGSLAFLELVKQANLMSPFENGTIKKAIEPIKAYLREVDDMKL